MAERIAPHPNVPLETAREAGTHIRFGGMGHENEYTISLPGLIGASGTEEISPRVSTDLQKRFGPDLEVVNRGSRLELLGPRDDERVKEIVLDYMDELGELGPK